MAQIFQWTIRSTSLLLLLVVELICCTILATTNSAAVGENINPKNPESPSPDYMNHCYGETPMGCLNGLAKRAQSQLTNKHMVMVGDSLTRYQYLTLAYTLRHSRIPDVNMQPNLNENTYHGWTEFFKSTNNVLSPYEKCDCSYVDGRFFEHRRYHDKHRNITVTYLMYRGQKGIQYTNDSNSLWAPHPQSRSAPHRNAPIHAILSQRYTPRPVDYVVLNVGFFGFSQDMTLEELLSGARKLSRNVIWKTTTSRMNERAPGYKEPPLLAKFHLPNRTQLNATDEAACAGVGTKITACMDTSWTRQVHQKYYWNSNHFLEPIYSLLNHQLITLISLLH